jgi:hypothetical protein
VGKVSTRHPLPILVRTDAQLCAESVPILPR